MMFLLRFSSLFVLSLCGTGEAAHIAHSRRELVHALAADPGGGDDVSSTDNKANDSGVQDPRNMGPLKDCLPCTHTVYLIGPFRFKNTGIENTAFKVGAGMLGSNLDGLRFGSMDFWCGLQEGEVVVDPVKIEFPEPRVVTGIMTLASTSDNQQFGGTEWVRRYKLAVDDNDEVDNTSVYDGNFDGQTIMTNRLNDGLGWKVENITITPTDWEKNPCIKIEMWGCKCIMPETIMENVTAGAVQSSIRLGSAMLCVYLVSLILG